MSAKKSTKSKSSKAAKPASAKKAKKPATPAEVQAPSIPAGECPKGGDHEWAEENGEQFCGKCKEPKQAKATNVKRSRKEPAKGKISAIDAAAQVLAEASTPMNCMELVEAMASKGLWESPGGKTPHATLYSAIIREIGLKGDAARFVKAERGRFAIKA